MKRNKVSKKGMTVTKFTEEQVGELLLAMESGTYRSHHSIAKAHAEKFEKSINNVYAKIRRLIGTKISAPGGTKPMVNKAPVVKEVPVAKIEVIEETVKPLTLPQGMTYQGTAKKVELHADHFRVYF